MVGIRSTTDAKEDRLFVHVDSSGRSGLFVVRTLLLGAKCVLLRRTWALALGGQADLAHMLRLIDAKLRRAMILTACNSIAATERSTLAECTFQ